MNEQDKTAELRDTVDAELAAEAAEEQGLLFTDDVSPLPSDLGYRGPTACNAAGITYRQLDYWARTGLVVPSVRDASGSGTQRLYSFRDIVVLKVVKRLLDAGVSRRSSGVILGPGDRVWKAPGGGEVVLHARAG